MGEAEHPAPGVADEVVAAVDPEVLQERLELVGEEVGGPERRVGVGQVLAAPVADLVVEDARAPADRSAPAIGAT